MQKVYRLGEIKMKTKLLITAFITLILIDGKLNYQMELDNECIKQGIERSACK